MSRWQNLDFWAETAARAASAARGLAWRRVEREIPLVLQTEVSPPLTFDQFIAAALRRDPDYIMVGETRTEETAVELIRAAETGHVVYNPTGDAVMEAGDTLIALGHRQQLDQLEALAGVSR